MFVLLAFYSMSIIFKCMLPIGLNIDGLDDIDRVGFDTNATHFNHFNINGLS